MTAQALLEHAMAYKYMGFPMPDDLHIQVEEHTIDGKPHWAVRIIDAVMDTNKWHAIVRSAPDDQVFSTARFACRAAMCNRMQAAIDGAPFVTHSGPPVNASPPGEPA